MADTKDIRSKFRLEFEAKGAERVQRQAEGVNKALGKEKLTGGMSELERLSKRNVRQMAGLSKHLKDVTKALQGMSKAAREVGTLADKLKKASDNAKGVGESARRANAEFKKGAFTQGFAQGMGVGPFLQRGPGMRRQAAGMVTGGAFRGAAAMPVRGSQAFAQGLASIPGGGLITAAMQNALGTFQSAVQQEADITGLGGVSRGAARRAGARATAVERERLEKQSFSEFRKDFLRTRRLGREKDRGSLLGKARSFLGLEDRPSAGGQEVVAAFQAQQANQNRRTERAAALAGSRARAGAMRRGMSPIRAIERIGVQQGLDPSQALQMAQQMGLSTLDPSLRQAAPSMGAALGLQRLGFGGAGEAGAFLRAERRGGIQGVGQERGAARRAIDETVGRAMAQGMERSEIRELLSQIAQGQDRFFTTGIPFARESIQEMTDGLSGALGPGLRSLRAAQQMTQGAQAVGARGPQNAAQVQLVRQIAESRGFGFGLEGMSKAMRVLEEKGARKEEVQSMLDRMGMPGGEAGAQIRKRFMMQAFPGFQLSAKGALRIGEVGLQKATTEGAVTDVEKLSKDRAALLDIRKGGQELRRRGIGQQIAPVAQTFEDAMITGSKSFANMAPMMTKVAEGASSVADLLPGFTKAIQNFIEVFGDDATMSNARNFVRTNSE